MKKLIFFLLMFSSICVSAQPCDTFPTYSAKEYIYKGDTLRYRVQYPLNYNKNKDYPLVVFLHGSGERGRDNVSQLKHGGALFADPQNRLHYPAIVIFPQCPPEDFWVYRDKFRSDSIIFPKNPPATKSLALVKRLLDSYVKEEAVDKRHIYALGISMGGMGTYDLICRYPRYFAAAVPICGAVNVERLKAVKHLPIRIFHGGADNVVSRNYSRDARTELKAEGNLKMEYIEFPGVGHNSWDPAFAYPDFLGWIFYFEK